MTPVLRPMSHLAPSTAYLVRMMSTDATGTRSMEIPVRPSRGNSRKRNGTRNQQSAPSSASKSSNAQRRNSKNEAASPTIQRHRLDVAIVGAPNAGKSQLLNALCGSTVAAVSRKRHTTRSGILGARTVNNQKQLVFVDTPGFMRYKSAKKEGLTRDLRISAEKEMEDVDYTLVVIDAARRLDDEMKEALVTLMLRAAASRGRIEASVDDDEGVVKTTRSASKKEIVREKFAVVLNKVDIVEPKEKLLDIATIVGEMGDECVRYIERECPTYEGEIDVESDAALTGPDPEVLEQMYPPVFYISALKDDGVDDVLNHLLSRTTPCSDWPVPANEAALMSPLERVEEVIREKVYRCLHREVPHQVRQVNRIFRTMAHHDTGDKIIRIDQDLVVRTESHRRLVTGRGGMTLRRIEADAEKDLKQVFACEVQLNLHVKFSKSRHERDIDSERSGVVQQTL